MVRRLFLPFFCACLSVMVITTAWAQSITSGDISGTVTDQSGGATPNAKVTLTNVNTNVSQDTVTNQQGVYRFAFLAPGTYSVTVKANGFQSQQKTGLRVVAGQPTVLDVQLQVAAATQTVEVTAQGEVLQTGNADVATTYNTEVLQNLPNPGGDITYVAQTAPGVVMNTQAGYGNLWRTECRGRRIYSPLMA